MTQRMYVPVRNIIGVLVVVESDTLNNDSSNSPEHLQHLGSWGSERNWHDLTAVCRRVGDEDSPWDTLEDLGGQHHWQRVGEVEHKDEAVEQHEVGDECPSVSNPAGQRTSKNDSNDGTNRTTHLERRLPRGLNNVLLLFFVPDTVIICKCG